MISNAQSSSNEQRLVGTWEYSGGNGWAIDSSRPWVFNSNGDMQGGFKLDYRDRTYNVVTYNVALNKLLLNYEGGAGVVFICEFYISSDGRTLIIIIEGEDERGKDQKVGLSFRKK
jgi:hypothetical protein